MREPEAGPRVYTGENLESRRPPDTSWGVGPWPVRRPDPERQWPTRLIALGHGGLRAIVLRPFGPS